MRKARTIAVVVSVAVTLVQIPRISPAAGSVSEEGSGGASVAAEAAIPLSEVDEPELIDGVRIVADTRGDTALVVDAVGRFAEAGWPLTNTVVRIDETECGDVVGFHTVERSRHLVVVCTGAEWVVLHELGHVWSDLYLDDAERAEWLLRRGLDSWSDGPWAQRGSEHAADIIAFGLSTELHVPRGIGVIDYDRVSEDFEWLFGVPPLHHRELAETDRAVPTAPRTNDASPVEGDGPEGTRVRFA